MEDGVLKCQFLAEDVTPLGSTFAVATGVTGLPDVAALHDGGFALGFKSGTMIASVKYGADGNPAGPIVEHGLPDGNNAGEGWQQRTNVNPSVVANGDGGYVIAWSDALWEDHFDYAKNFDEHVKAQLVGGDGSPAGPAFQVTNEDTGGFVTPTLIELDDGGFYVTWAKSFVPDGSPWTRGSITYVLAGRGFDVDETPPPTSF